MPNRKKEKKSWSKSPPVTGNRRPTMKVPTAAGREHKKGRATACNRSARETGVFLKAQQIKTRNKRLQVRLKEAATPSIPHRAPIKKPEITIGALSRAQRSGIWVLSRDIQSQTGAILTAPTSAAEPLVPLP